MTGSKQYPRWHSVSKPALDSISSKFLALKALYGCFIPRVGVIGVLNGARAMLRGAICFQI